MRFLKTGTKEPIVRCTRDSDKQVVTDSNCNSSKPSPPALPCDMGECPPTYYWKELWGKCSAVCGTGNSVFQSNRASHINIPGCTADAKLIGNMHSEGKGRFFVINQLHMKNCNQ